MCPPTIRSQAAYFHLLRQLVNKRRVDAINHDIGSAAVQMLAATATAIIRHSAPNSSVVTQATAATEDSNASVKVPAYVLKKA